MSLYPVALFLHIVGALGVFAALALEWASLSNLRRAVSAGQVREWTRLLGMLPRIGGPSALTLLITGIYLSATRWGGQAWIGLSLLGLVLIAVLGAAVSGRRIRAIARQAFEEDAISGALRRQLDDRALMISAWFRTGLALGIVFLMSAKPAPAIAFIGLGVFAVLGLAVGFALGTKSRSSAPRTARAAES